MKRIIVWVVVLSVLLLAACSGPKSNGPDYSGVYEGVSWKGESQGVTLEEATEKIVTKMTLNKEGIIESLEMDFLVLKDGNWNARNDSTTEVKFDSSVNLVSAEIAADGVKAGTSMFQIKTNDMMSLFVVGVDDNNVVGYGIVDPMTRYLFEAKFDKDFDFQTKIGELKLGDGFTPTILTSGGGLLKPKSWDEIKENSILDVSIYSHVINIRGLYKGISNDTTVQELLELSGVVFASGIPQTKEASYGFHSTGGWEGNYKAIAQNLVGKDAKTLVGLTDFSGKSYAGGEYRLGIDKDNFFGIYGDDVTGATKTIQKSYDTIMGATVRISRENTSFQRALVQAGILEESEVIKGRF